MESGNSVFFGWWVVFAAGVALATGGPPALLTIGILAEPWSREFGFSPHEVRLAIGCGLAAWVLTAPLVGRLVDRFGARRIVMPSMALLASGLVALRWIGPDALHLYVAVVAVAVFGAGVSPVSLGRPVALWFERRRGLALGLALAGLGFAVLGVPGLTGALAAAAGWRWASTAHALTLLVIALPITAALLRDAPAAMGLAPDGAPLSDPQRAALTDTRPPPGYSIELVRQQRQFWSMALAFLVAACGLGGALSLIARLADVGWAAVPVPAIGAALLAGLILGGWLADRWFAPRVAVTLCLCAAAATYAVASYPIDADALAGLCVIAFVAGTHLTLAPYLVSRCFGLRAFASGYSWQFAAFTAGLAIAPLLATAGYGMTGSGVGPLLLCGSLLLVAAGLLSRIPPYPNWSFGPGFRVNPGAGLRGG